MVTTIPEQTAVKIDNPDSEWHGEAGFVIYNHRSGVVEACDDCMNKDICETSECEEGYELPERWYMLVFDPMDTGGFKYCKEQFHEDDLVIRGC